MKCVHAVRNGTKKNGGAIMKRSLFVSILALFIGGFFALSLRADDTLARFKGGIGVHPVSNFAGTANADGSCTNVTRNVDRSIKPARQLWVIGDLDARVSKDGDLKTLGKGLTLAGRIGAG